MKKLSHCLNGYEQAAANVTLRSIRSSMERERARTRPRVPATLAELDPVLRDFDQTRPPYIAVWLEGEMGQLLWYLELI